MRETKRRNGVMRAVSLVTVETVREMSAWRFTWNVHRCDRFAWHVWCGASWAVSS